MSNGIRIGPATALALLALFFALGGSAFALGTKVAPQARCVQGAVRGLLEVTGQPSHGVANLPDQYTSDRSYFGRTFNCGGGAVQARRLSAGVYDVRFVGNAASSALVSGMGGDGAGADITRSPDGSFHVTLSGHGQPGPEDVPFTVVLF
jgi:hypothetical protein